MTVAIETIRLGQRVIGENPEPFDVDPDFADPVQSATRRIVATVFKEDGTAVDVEMLRDARFVDALGLVPGSLLPLHLAELDVQGIAKVTEVTECPPIQQGEGQVVTARFVTRHAENRVRVTLSDGTAIIATDVHPFWTPENRQWTPAGELLPGTVLDTLRGELTVRSVEPLRDAAAVYNIEVNGHHVYRVADVGVLVHNTCPRATDGRFASSDTTPIMHNRDTEYPHGYRAGIVDNVLDSHTIADGPDAGKILTADGDVVSRDHPNLIIEHIQPVVIHWNTIGHDVSRTVRNDFYNDTSNMTLRLRGPNSSGGGILSSQGLRYRQDVGPNYS